MKKDITVLGLGYIGLPTAIILAKAGHNVKGYDPNSEVIHTLNSGKIHIVENNLQEAYQSVLESGNFKAYSELQKSDVYIICVPTPFLENEDEKIADLSYVDAAARMVSTVVKEGDLVILESTVPPLTTRRITDIIEKESGISREKFYTVHCPERVLPGRILYELEHNDRIIGSENKEAALKAKELYDDFVKEGTNYVTDDVTAELCKLLENTYRDVNIALANEVAIICNELGINVFDLISLANKHPRVNILSPGVGVGGHCLAVDPWFIVERFKEQSNLIRIAREKNDNMPYWVSEQIEKQIGYNKETKIGILGLAYKPNIDDLRESPSVILALDLINKGYNIVACEPNTNLEELKGIKVLPYEKVIEESDFLVITLAHNEFTKDEVKQKILSKPNYNCIGLE